MSEGQFTPEGIAAYKRLTGIDINLIIEKQDSPGNNFCVIYDKGSHDSVEESGSLMKCRAFINAVQPAFDKKLRIVTRDQVRGLYLTETEIVTGYSIA